MEERLKSGGTESMVEPTRSLLRRLCVLALGIRECFVCGSPLPAGEGVSIGNGRFVCNPAHSDCRERAVHEGNGVVS